MRLDQVVGHAAASVTEFWEQLARPASNPALFDPLMVVDLSEPARRWLTHAIAPGTPLYRAVILEIEGYIRLGRWLRFRAVHLHAPPDGYVWAAMSSLALHDLGRRCPRSRIRPRLSWRFALGQWVP